MPYKEQLEQRIKESEFKLVITNEFGHDQAVAYGMHEDMEGILDVTDKSLKPRIEENK